MAERTAPINPDVWARYRKTHEFHPDAPSVDLVAFAWPFDQGLDGKPEQNDQVSLWADADNLDEIEWRALLGILRSNELNAHNAKFDLEKMRVGVRTFPGVGSDLQANVVWDTQNVQHFMDPLLPHPDTGRPTTSLKPVSQVKFGKKSADESKIVQAYLKKQKLPPGRWDLMPWDIIGDYATMDAILTHLLMLRQQYDLVHGAVTWTDDPDALIARRLSVMKLLYRMEWRGLPYDEVESRLAAEECKARAKKVAEALPFKPTLNAAKAFFFAEGTTDKGVACLNMVPYSVTDTGAPQMTAEIVERMVADDIPHAARWSEYSKVTNAASMWYEAYADRMGNDGRLRTCFRQNGTASSRFSVERVNLQAIPQDYRLSEFRILDGIPTPRDLIASAVPDGWRIWELDLAQAELRVAAMWAECTTMLDMISKGEDLHSFTTNALFPGKFNTPEWGKFRQVGKRGNFSLIFGSGWKTFQGMVSKETGIRLEDWDAQRITKDWNALYPEFRAAIEKHMHTVERRQSKNGRGYIDLITGERRWFGQYEEAHKAFNQRVQGNLAQFGIDWMLDTDLYLMSQGFGEPGSNDGLLLTIHDSQVLLLPDTDQGEEMAARCAARGKEIWKTMFPGVPGDVDYKKWGGK